MPDPKITIITVSRNAEKYIEQTIMSVVGQTYPNIEYIVVDGASTDRTIDIVKKHKNKITKWISEPDRGIADAMNKGLALTTGDLILFLHADDYLLSSDVINAAVTRMAGNFDIYAFNLRFSRSGGSTLLRPRGFDWRMNFKTGLLHPAVFCQRRVFDQIGPFCTGYRIAMDYEFFLRAYRRRKDLKISDMPVTVMRDTGISSRTDWPSLRERFLEEKRIHALHCSGLPMRGVYMLYWIAYLTYRRLKAVSALLTSK